MSSPPWAAGNAAVRAGRLQEALACYTHFLEAGIGSAADRATVRSNRAHVYLQLQQPAEALADAEAALVAEPAQPKALYRRVMALAQLGRRAEAEAAAAAAQNRSMSAEDKRRIREAAQQPAKQSGSGGGTGQHVALAASDGPSGRRVPDSSWLPSEMRQESVFIPPRERQVENVLLMLHGLGDSPGNYAKLARKMALPATLCLALAAPRRLPVELGVDGGMWYQPHFLALDERQGWAEEAEGYQATLSTLCQLLRKLHEQGGWPFSRLHLFGFSQGGSVALGLAAHFRGKDRLGGCVSISGSLLEHAREKIEAEAPPRTPGGTPILITHGDRDDQVPRAAINRSVAALKALGCPVRLLSVPGKGHAMVGSEPEMRALMQHWAETLKAAPPSGTTAGEQYVEVRQ